MVVPSVSSAHGSDQLLWVHTFPSVEELELALRVWLITYNAICERLIGTIRCECLDLLIPMSEAHLRTMLSSWAGHYNGSSLRQVR
jgi:hypothetical protein